MRRAALLALGLSLLPGCVPTADFTALRVEVRQMQAENRKLRETAAELRKRLDEQERTLKPAEAAKRLDALDQKLGDLKRQGDETSRQVEGLAARLEETEAKSHARGQGRDTKADPSADKPAKGDGLEASTVLTPTAAYNLAYNDYLKGNYDLAVAGFENFLRQFPATSLTAHAQYWIGEAYYNKKEYRSAIEAYERVLADHPKSDRVAAALYKSGIAYAALADTAKARGLFKRILEEHPQSNEATLARQRLADLR